MSDEPVIHVEVAAAVPEFRVSNRVRRWRAQVAPRAAKETNVVDPNAPIEGAIVAAPPVEEMGEAAPW